MELDGIHVLLLAGINMKTFVFKLVLKDDRKITIVKILEKLAKFFKVKIGAQIDPTAEYVEMEEVRY